MGEKRDKACAQKANKSMRKKRAKSDSNTNLAGKTINQQKPTQ